MDAYQTLNGPISLTFPGRIYRELTDHLFPGDNDEHGAVLLAGVAVGTNGTRLLARELLIAKDGVDYVRGKRGYRMLRGEFISDVIGKCHDEQLVYLATHNHGGDNFVAFSPDDIASHERGYPALLDISHGMPVGALVFANNAIAGSLWMPNGERRPLDHAVVLGTSRRILRDRLVQKRQIGTLELYDRQARLFGDTGQAILSSLHVAIVGIGGVGTLLVEYLSRLGVGEITVIDPDRIEWTNLPRLIGARPLDAMPWLTREGRPEWMRAIGRRLQTRKVDYAERLARRANPNIVVNKHFRSVVDADVARALTRCDYIFLAADMMQARLLVNAVVHQYLIPGVQLGAKVSTDKRNGEILDVFTTCRPMTTSTGCLMCNGAIDLAKLQEESLTDDQLRKQRYVDDETVVAPSVIGLNSIPVTQAVNDFTFFFTGLQATNTTHEYILSRPLERAYEFARPRHDPVCRECGASAQSRLARGDLARLPSRA